MRFEVDAKFVMKDKKQSSNRRTSSNINKDDASFNNLFFIAQEKIEVELIDL